MRNPGSWVPTNIVPTPSGWRPNPDHIAPWSSHVTSLECPAYVQTIEQHAQGNLLDVGAGTMPYYGVYKSRTGAVIGTDWSHSPHNTSHISVISDANHGLPFKSTSFDTVLVADVLEHLNQPQVLVDDAARVLRVAGKLIMFVPFMYGLHEEPVDYYRYTRHQLLKMCESAGLNIVELEAFGGGPDVVADLIEKMSYASGFLGKIVRKSVTIAAKTELFHSLRQKYAERFPIGYTVVAQKLED